MAVYQMLIWQYARRRRYARRHMLTLPLLLILSMAWPSELREYDRSRVFVALNLESIDQLHSPRDVGSGDNMPQIGGMPNVGLAVCQMLALCQKIGTVDLPCGGAMPHVGGMPDVGAMPGVGAMPKGRQHT